MLNRDDTTPQHQLGPLAAHVWEQMTSEFPTCRMRWKAGDPLSKLIDLALRLLTFGRQNRYLSHYHTQLGKTLYLPEHWKQMSDVDRAILLRHEAVHLRQGARYGFIGMAFLYLIPIFPLGLAWGRARIEWEAYRETLIATAELRSLEEACSLELESMIIQRFCGADYGWMWPFPKQVRKWIRSVHTELKQDFDALSHPNKPLS